MALAYYNNIFNCFHSTSHYQVIVHLVKDWTDQIPEKYRTLLKGYDKSQDQNQNFYIAAELPSSSIHPSLSFIIGDARSYGPYENVALLKTKKYKIYIRAVTTFPKVKICKLQLFPFCVFVK